VLAYVVRRLLWAGLLVLVMTFVTYVIFFRIPADPARFLVRNQAPTEHQLEEARKRLGLDEPFLVQYGRFVWRLAHLDLGVSYQSFGGRNPILVTRLLAEAAPVTASLIVGGAVLWLMLSIPLGTLSALRAGSAVDRGILLLVLIGISAHPVSIGLFLRQFLGYKWQLAPVNGYCPLFGSGDCAGPGPWLSHLILPWFTFALLFTALYTRMVRNNVLFGLEENWVRTARGKGATELRVLRSHVLRTSLLPVVTMLGMDIGVAFGGAIFVERVFGLPGLGSLALTALSGNVGFDLPLIVGVVLCVTTAVIVFNLVVDLLAVVLDPRISLT
jgi:peptide/nickel transport system permease protein